jgi:hypothetical protein
VVVVAPATAVAGAATTTRFRKGNIPASFPADGRIRSRGEIIYAERGGFDVSVSTDPALVG